MSRRTVIVEILDTLCEGVREIRKAYDEGEYNHAQYIDELSQSIDGAFEEIDEIYTKTVQPKIILKTQQDIGDWNQAQFETENQ